MQMCTNNCGQGNLGHVQGKTPIGSHFQIMNGCSFRLLHPASLKGLEISFGLTWGVMGPRPGGSNFNELHGQGFRGCSVDALNCKPLVSHSFLPVSVTGALIWLWIPSRATSLVVCACHGGPARLTTSYCALSREWPTTNMQNHLVHHLISSLHEHWSPLCTMVHNAGRWCTT